MTRPIYRPALALLLLTAALMAAVAEYRTPAMADELGVEIVEPSIIPQTWGYSPDPVTTRIGEAIHWVNTGIAPHSVTAYDGSFDSGIMLSGQHWSLTVDTPGVFEYYCILHPDMRSTLIVVED